jgi:Uncharacterized conserved protein
MSTPDRPEANPSGLPQAYRVVAIGGGTGLSALLHGLKRFAPPRPGSDRLLEDHHAPSVDITAVVTVTDDGGSSGRGIL